MANQEDYFLILKALKFKASTEAAEPALGETARLQHNLQVLQKNNKDNVQQLLHQIAQHLKLDDAAFGAIKIDFKADAASCYTIYLQHVLLCILRNGHLYTTEAEQLISVNNQNLCLEAAKDLSHYALATQLHEILQRNQIYQLNLTSTGKVHASNYALLHLSLAFFEQLLQEPLFRLASVLHVILSNYLAAIVSMRIASALGQHEMPQVEMEKLQQQQLNHVWLNISKVEFFHNILLLISIKELPSEVKAFLNKNLHLKLASTGGFAALVSTLLANKQHTEQQIFEIVAKLAGNPKLSQAYQTNMIGKVLAFLQQCLRNEHMMEGMGAGVLTLRRLYDLNAQNQPRIENTLRAFMLPLSAPPDMLTGLILMDHSKFSDLVLFLFHLFCTSSIECLPSDLLVDFLPLLLQLHFNLPGVFQCRQHLASLIMRCLHNRSDAELQQIIERLYMRNFCPNWLQLHQRVLVVPNDSHTQVELKIAASDFKQEFNIFPTLPELLTTNQHNILSYKIFMQLLQILWRLLATQQQTSKKTYLFSPDEAVDFVEAENASKIDLLLSLNALVSHDGLIAQIAENAAEFVQFLSTLLQARIKYLQQANAEETDQILLILLTITHEIAQQWQQPQKLQDLLPQLKQLQQQTANELIKQRIIALNALLTGTAHAQPTAESDAAFRQARLLIQGSEESYMQVYGIQMLLDLMHRKDAATLANTPLLVALALSTLKSKESYTFLNCVRLFVALVHVSEAEVLELLSNEYLQDNADMDFRLVIGEAILKVCAELGPLCYKYKNTLVNTFMAGARSPIDEFRMSSYANLAQLCRILSYQVHKFFQELLHLIDCELSIGKYLPAKRAAVLVLSELLEGMDNLLDFQEMLLPIYKLLRLLESNVNCDKEMRQHAANGLKTLNKKCLKFMFPEQQLQKELKIMNINEKKVASKKHFLQIL